jgi:peptidoglycan-N-acetylglucosamine deacetylase
VIRNPVPWPNGARCAVALTFDMDADSILHLAHHTSAHTRVAGLSGLRYGPQVAVPRILDMYRRYGIKQTFFLPAWCMERYPDAVEAIMKDGHEIAHHSYLHEHPNELTAEQERYWFERALDVIVKMTGKKPKGFRAATYKFSVNTLDILLKHGLDYDASLFGDDVPYLLKNGKGNVIELPSHYGLDDWPHYQVSRDFNYIMAVKAPSQALQVFIDEFEAAWEYGGLWISVWHPFLSGRLARAAAIDKLLAHMAKKGKVWFATLEEIAAHSRKMMAEGKWQPRIDTLPYYEGPIPELGAAAPELVRP